MGIFKQKPMKTVECGGFIVSFYYKEGDLKHTYMEITTESNVWSMRIAGNTHAYGYLLAAAHQDMTEQIHGYAAMLYVTSQQLTKDQGFVDDITKSITKWQRRMDKKAESAAKNVKDFEEVASQAFMEEAAEYAAASPKERKRISEKFKAEIRSIEQNV